MVDEKKLARLERVRELLVKNSNAYYRTCEHGLSRTMYSWIDEYEGFKGTEEWDAMCKAHGSDPGHDAYDLWA